MKKKSTFQSASFEHCALISLFVVLVGTFLALLAAANPSSGDKFRNASKSPDAPTSSKLTTRASVRVTPHAVLFDQSLVSKGESVLPATGETRLTRPWGNTLWMVDDPNAIADGVRIDSNNVWGAWILTGARLSIYAISGNGTPLWEFSSFNSGNTGVAAAKGSNRAGLMESNSAGNEFLQHGFTSASNGTPDWSYQYPVSDPNLPASSFKVAVSRDGSTMAAVVSDSITQNSTLYIFDAATGTITRTWTNSLRMDAVALTDNGSLALVTQDNQATLIDTATGNIEFTATGSGAGSIYYPISGDGSVFVVGGFNFDVYASMRCSECQPLKIDIARVVATPRSVLGGLAFFGEADPPHGCGGRSGTKGGNGVAVGEGDAVAGVATCACAPAKKATKPTRTHTLTKAIPDRIRVLAAGCRS
jgi:hypothetical protein